MRYDVIVVGAGPAGSTAARECASLGLDVLIVDKAEFPRDKPCGGGVTWRASELLPFDLTPVIERMIFGINVSVRRSKGFTRRSPQTITFLTQRSHLDAFLLEKAVEAGAVLREGSPVQGIERFEDHVVVRTSGEVFEGRALVAADGANGPTSRMAGVDVQPVHDLALEGNITPKGEFPKEWEDVLGLDFGSPPGGYGWIFPKGDHLNIGIGGWNYLGPSLRARLKHLVRFYGYDPEEMWGLRGHHLPLLSSTRPLVDGNMLIVGDAGGLLDPITGEGIYAAIWSGQVAAEHLALYVAGEVPTLDAYRAQVERELLPDLQVSRQFHDLFHLSPRFYMAIERRTSILWRLACRILLGQQTYAGAMAQHRVIATLIDLVSDLVRVTPRLQKIAGIPQPAPPQRFFLHSAHDR